MQHMPFCFMTYSHKCIYVNNNFYKIFALSWAFEVCNCKVPHVPDLLVGENRRAALLLHTAQELGGGHVIFIVLLSRGALDAVPHHTLVWALQLQQDECKPLSLAARLLVTSGNSPCDFISVVVLRGRCLTASHSAPAHEPLLHPHTPTVTLLFS